ncbi:MAG TPA: alpha/beta fold hydrolase [Actinomycetota bacterium]|nr:alpha/beta fold hydrolase [Actinomycetota bacterium]
MAVFDRGGRGIAYRDEGDGPAVVLLHGLLMDGSLWDPQVEALRDSYRVVTIEAPGHGDSDPAVDGYTFDDGAEGVWALLDGIGVERAVVGGQSMGGWTALRCALSRPHATRGLILIDTSAGPEDPEKLAQYEAFLDVALTDGVSDDLAAILLMLLFSGAFAQTPAAEPWRKKLISSDPGRFAALARAVFSREPVEQRLGEIAAPALVIHGIEDISIPMERAEQLSTALRAPLHRIEGAGHAASHEKPAQVTPILRAFLDGLPG